MRARCVGRGASSRLKAGRRVNSSQVQKLRSLKFAIEPLCCNAHQLARLQATLVCASQVGELFEKILSFVFI